MRFPRIKPYMTHVIGDDGGRTRLDAHELVLERPLGVDLEINLAPHPGFRGSVTFSTFRGSSLVLEPDAGNSVHLFIEDWPRGDRRRKDDRARKRTPLCHVYAVDARGKKSAISGRAFAVEIGRGAELHIDLTPPSPWAHHVSILSVGGPLGAQFGAANSVHFSVNKGLRWPAALAAKKPSRARAARPDDP